MARKGQGINISIPGKPKAVEAKPRPADVRRSQNLREIERRLEERALARELGW